MIALAVLFQDASLPATTAASAGPLATGAHSSALVDMLHNSGPMALTVLLLLLIASIFSWAVMFSKWRAFREADAQNRLSCALSASRGA